MPLSFHGFSFDLFGFSWRRSLVDDPVFSERKNSANAQSVPAKTGCMREREVEDAPEVSFRTLCIFPIL
ncbi:hypothetical protein [Allorhizobium terrae]|uniref:Uncharacterized protein n=1 Tax=Allorhizobium terrae TaxID=1848972 RepID=A0A4V3W975_9HYPH|nr:hypothetical protein [Allorhizobium terrae]THF54057.1 hypothetical protein E6C51_02905 [Allorhizobium terrae]